MVYLDKFREKTKWWENVYPSLLQFLFFFPLGDSLLIYNNFLNACKWPSLQSSLAIEISNFLFGPALIHIHLSNLRPPSVLYTLHIKPFPIALFQWCTLLQISTVERERAGKKEGKEFRKCGIGNNEMISKGHISFNLTCAFPSLAQLCHCKRQNLL